MFELASIVQPKQLNKKWNKPEPENGAIAKSWKRCADVSLSSLDGKYLLPIFEDDLLETKPTATENSNESQKY